MSEKFFTNRTKLLPITIGLIYCWFGCLKFITGLSPAEDLVEKTFDVLLFGLFSSSISIKLLGLIECLIGIFLIINKHKKTVIKITLIHLVFTFSPLFLFPELTFALAGQYILKNIIIIGALLSIYPFKKKKSIIN